LIFDGGIVYCLHLTIPRYFCFAKIQPPLHKGAFFLSFRVQLLRRGFLNFIDSAALHHNVNAFADSGETEFDAVVFKTFDELKKLLSRRDIHIRNAGHNELDLLFAADAVVDGGYLSGVCEKRRARKGYRGIVIVFVNMYAEL